MFFSWVLVLTMIVNFTLSLFVCVVCALTLSLSPNSYFLVQFEHVHICPDTTVICSLVSNINLYHFVLHV
jgi:hypothetical protein